MRPLSNLFRSRDSTGPLIRPIGPGEIETGVRLLIGATDAIPSAAAAAADFEAVAEGRGIDLTRMQVAALDDKLIAAALPVESGGHAVLLMLSPAGVSRKLAIAAAQCAKACVAASPVRAGGREPLFQILIDPQEWKTAETLRDQQFEELATLLYLQRTLLRPLDRPQLPDGLSLITDSPEHRPLFAAAIEGSYEASLDCPKLHGRRTIDEVIAAHKATGIYDPARWFCLIEHGRPLGALLVSAVAGTGVMELVYLGLTMPGRGRGFGDLLMQHALAEASHFGDRQLTLAVDDKNIPALQLYYRHGLAQVQSRLAMIYHAG